MKNFFENFKTYVVWIISTIVAIIGIVQMINITSAIASSEVALKNLYVYEILIVFIVALIFYASWWLDTFNKLRVNPISDKLLVTMKTYVKLFILLSIVIFMNYQTIEIISVIAGHVKHMGSFYSIEITVLLVIMDLFVVKYFYDKIKEINKK